MYLQIFIIFFIAVQNVQLSLKTQYDFLNDHFCFSLKMIFNGGFTKGKELHILF